MIGNHLVSHIKHSGLRHDQNLYVIGVCSNPVRYQSRYRLARQWLEKMAKTKNVVLTIVECAFGDRHHELQEATQEAGCEYIPLRTNSEIWIKENMINIGARTVIAKYPSCQYLAWIDMDVFFRDPNWALETVHQLQHFEVVQPWTDCLDLGPQGNVIQHFRSFGYNHQKRVRKQKYSNDYGQYSHSGFAWACTRRFWEATQGLLDFCILGSADHHMAWAMIGDCKSTIHDKMCYNFHKRIYDWETKAVRITKKEVGFVMGTIEHQFHGPKKRRYYRERWQILVDNKFDPDKDLMYDPSGIIQLCGKPNLEQDLRFYNRSRMEDSIETE